MKHSSEKLDFHCTSIMASLGNNLRSARLKDLAEYFLNAKTISYAEAKSAGKETFLMYAANDAEYTFGLFPILKVELEEKDLWSLYQDVEKPFVLVNLECQNSGIRFDLKSAALEIDRLKCEIFKQKQSLDDPSINWNSSKQLQRKIFGDYGLPLTYDKGRLSTGRRALKSLSFDLRIQSILELKKLESLLRQIRSLEKFVDPRTGCIHPYMNPLGADTGRVTSSCPNLQNIEKKSILRNLFRAKEGHKLIVADFGQIEPRVLAHFLPHSKFSALFETDSDFYDRIAEVLDLTVDGGPIPRDVAKQVVLATFYGMGARTLGENLKIPKESASEILNRFFSAFPEINVFRENEILLAIKRGFTVGLLNRRRYIENLHDSDDWKRFRAERQVLNSIIQGSAATLFKFKLVQLRRELPSSVQFLHHVHDEVILQVQSRDAENTYEKTKAVLQTPVPWFSIPLLVDGGIGQSWGEAKGKK